MELESRTDSSGTPPLTKHATAAASSKTLLIGIGITVAVGLAVGLGAGLGVGLSNVEYVYVTEGLPKTTKAPPPPPTQTPQTTRAQTTTVAKTTETATETPETTTIGPEPSTPPPTGPWTNYRLPNTLIPSNYKITLQPNLTTDIFTGTNEITFKANAATRYVIIHAHATLNITESSVKLEQKATGGGLTQLDIKRQFRYPDNEFYIIEAENELSTGEEFVLTMDFANSLVAAIIGIYKSSFTDPADGTKKGVVASDFEPTDARRGFPCFDEPAMKATYTTTLIHEQQHTALSNMPVKETVDLGNGLNRTSFETSVPMSTYLSCFVVGELDYVEDFSGRNIPLRIYGAKYQIDGRQGDYALLVTKAMFDKYEELYGMNYSLPKYDQVAVPEFRAGAMENWGLVTYRESNLMWDPKESSTYNKQRVAAVIAHEMVHQWFGNIVTMKWWNNIWLNEGFASFFEYDGLRFAEPEWESDAFNVIGDVQTAMRVDQTTGSHPIVVNVSTPAQISEVFDTITYQKGASVLRMMKNILGNDLFIGGLRNYLQKRYFSSADEQDLWADVQEYVDSNGGGYNVKEIMDPWVQQFGYPIINVDVSSSNLAKLTQEQMLSDTNSSVSLPESDYGYKWNVKVDYYTEQDSAIQEHWLNISDADLQVNTTDAGDWLKFNKDQTGYYRVNLGPQLLGAVADQLESNLSVFSQIDRCNMMDDAFNLAATQSDFSYELALNLTTYLDEEDSYFVWSAFSSGSSYIRYMLANTEHFSNFQTYYVEKVKPIVQKIGWNASTGTHEEKRMRPLVLNLALRLGDSESLANATELFKQWRAGEYIHPDVRSLVYIFGIYGGTVEDWEFMLDKYKSASVAGEKTILLRGLASTENVELIDRLITLTNDSSVIKEQDVFTCLTYISYTPTGNRMVWSYLKLHWLDLVKRFTIEDRYLGRLVPSVSEDYNTELQKWEVEAFFKQYPEAGAGEQGRINALLRIDSNIAWVKENADAIGLWLKDRLAEM